MSTGSQTVPPRMVHGRRHIGELHEIAEILDRRITAARHRGRARRAGHRPAQTRWIAADLHVALGIARMLGELRRRRLHKFAAQPLGKVNALTLDVGAGVLPDLQRFSSSRKSMPTSCRTVSQLASIVAKGPPRPALHKMSDEDDIDLSALSDDELVQQMHDDLYDGLKEEIEEGVNILLERGWAPYEDPDRSAR
jgi:hypothetical protein